MKSDKWDVNPSVISALLSLHHLKQTDVAGIVGVHSSQIGRRLRGEGHWTSKDVGKLADRLGVSPDTFYLSTTEFLRRLTVSQNDEKPPPDDGGENVIQWYPHGLLDPRLGHVTHVYGAKAA